MSKIKVYELAKELGVPSKEVIEFLGGKNIEVKNHMSSLEDADADMARKALTKGNKDAAAKPEAEAPKKKNIVHVFRPQNTQNGAKQGRRPQGQGRPQPNRQTPQQGRPMQVNNGRPAKQQARPAAPAQEPTQQARPQERTADKSFEQARRPAAASQERVQTQERQAERPATDRSQAPRRQERSDDRRQDSRGTSGNRQAARSREAAHRGIARITRREAARSREAVHREIARIVRKATETRAASQAKGRTGAITTGEAMMPFQRLRHRHRSRSAAR